MSPVCRAISGENGRLETDAHIFTEGGDDRGGYENRLFVEKIGGTIFAVNAMPVESAKHTQEEIVKALIAREAMALKDADIG